MQREFAMVITHAETLMHPPLPVALILGDRSRCASARRLLFVSLRPARLRAERTQNEDYLQICHWGSRGGRGF